MSKAGSLYAKHKQGIEDHLVDKWSSDRRAMSIEWVDICNRQQVEAHALPPTDRTFYLFLVTSELARCRMLSLQEDGTDLRGVQLPLPGTIASDTSRFGETQ